jgi:hypothetical protein
MPQLAWAKATPWGVYCTGVSHYGDRFARDLGHLFERYIGRQVRLLDGAKVLPEITYGPRNSRRKTVDWIVVLPEVVLLVEVKSAIPTEPVRLGAADAAQAMIRKLGEAFNHIDATAQLIADRDPALAAVPADRPVLGMAVTHRRPAQRRQGLRPCRDRARHPPRSDPECHRASGPGPGGAAGQEPADGSGGRRDAGEVRAARPGRQLHRRLRRRAPGCRHQDHLRRQLRGRVRWDHADRIWLTALARLISRRR